MRLFGTVLGPGEAEQTIERSRFICYVSPAESREEAEEFFAAIRKKHKDATHNVPAMVLGDKMQIQWASDDGEPQGTSGAPMAQMLVSMGLTNVAVIVTRYFGGTMLGIGGLIQAYSECAKQVIENSKIIETEILKTVKFSYDFDLVPIVRNIVNKFNAKIVNEKYDKTAECEISINT